MRQYQRHISGDGTPDVARCMSGRCIGRLCPCLCHTTLKIKHEAIVLRLDHRRARRRRGQGKRGRARAARA